MATTQCFHPNVLFQFIFLPLFFNTVALVLWGNKALTGFIWKDIFSKCSSCVKRHLKRQSLFSDIYVQGWSYGGRNGAVTHSVLMVLQVLRVAFITRPAKGAFTVQMSLAQPPAPNVGALRFICFTDAIHKKSFGGLLTPVAKHWWQNIAVQRTISLRGYLYLKTCFWSNSFHCICILEQSMQNFLFSPDPAEVEILLKSCVSILSLSSVISKAMFC